MPGDQSSYDLIRVKDGNSNSKADTFFIAPKGLGNGDFPVEDAVIEVAEITDAADLPADAIDSGEIDLSTVAGDGINVDTANNELDTAPDVGSPDWEEDPNSPSSVSGGTGVSVSLAETYDMLWVQTDFSTTAFGNDFLQLNLNGNTGFSYDFIRYGGGTETGKVGITVDAVTSIDPSLKTQLFIQGRFDQKASVNVLASNPALDTTVATQGHFQSGNNGDTIDTIKLQYNGQSFTGDMQVFGRDIP